MLNPFDKHKFAEQPVYHTKVPKIKAREQVIRVYRDLTKKNSIPKNKGYWTFCNKQPNSEGAEIVQLIKSGLISKNQFHGVDYDLKNEGIIEFNRREHPEANWYKGVWIEVIEDNYEKFNPAIVYFDYTKTVVTLGCHKYLARTMNMCQHDTLVAANLMLSDGHSSKRFDPAMLVENLGIHLRNPNDWSILERYYSYKASRTEMATYVFYRN